MCKVLEHEEKRCMYVSMQISHYLGKVSKTATTSMLSPLSALNDGSSSIDNNGGSSSGVGGSSGNDGGGSVSNNNGDKGKSGNTNRQNSFKVPLSTSIDKNYNPFAHAIGMYSSKNAKHEEHNLEKEEEQK